MKLYTYPDWEDPIAIFDEDELDKIDTMQVLCVKAQPDDEYRQENTVYVWTGPDFEVSKYGDSALPEQQFVHKCMEDYWGEQEASRNQVKIVTVDSDQPSDEFMYFFD